MKPDELRAICWTRFAPEAVTLRDGNGKDARIGGAGLQSP
jgi:hypothetical protein